MKKNYLIWIVNIIKSTYCLCLATAFQQKLDILKHPNWPAGIQDQCGLSFSDRIIGGVNASLGQYPWLVRIGYNS